MNLYVELFDEDEGLKINPSFVVEQLDSVIEDIDQQKRRRADASVRSLYHQDLLEAIVGESSAPTSTQSLQRTNRNTLRDLVVSPGIKRLRELIDSGNKDGKKAFDRIITLTEQFADHKGI